MQPQPPSVPGWGQPEQSSYAQQPEQYPQYYQQPQTQYPSYSQQPQSQYYPPPQQFPMTSMTPQQPPKKRHSRRNIIISVVAAVIVIAIIVAYAGKGASTPTATNQSTPTAHTTTQATSQSTSQPTSAPTQAANKIGAPVPSGAWIVTLNSVKTNTGDGLINVPKAGNVYLVVNITLKNTDSSVQTTSSFVQWKLLDPQGQSYNEDITFGGSSPDGAVAPGQQSRGDIAFEVPTSMHQFTLQFEDSLLNPTLVQWTVTI